MESQSNNDPMEAFSASVKARIREMRDARRPRLTQEAMAEAMKLSQGTVSSNLSKRRLLSEEFIVCLEQTFPSHFQGLSDEFFKIKHAARLPQPQRLAVERKAELRREVARLTDTGHKLIDELADKLQRLIDEQP